jgi:hypothetical protein
VTGPGGRVRIVVERLVLDGLDPATVGDVDALVAGVTAELHRLAADRTGLARTGPHRTAVPDVRGPDIALTGPVPAQEIGRRIGGAVHAAVGGVR